MEKKINTKVLVAPALLGQGKSSTCEKLGEPCEMALSPPAGESGEHELEHSSTTLLPGRPLQPVQHVQEGQQRRPLLRQNTDAVHQRQLQPFQNLPQEGNLNHVFGPQEPTISVVRRGIFALHISRLTLNRIYCGRSNNIND